MKRLLALTVYLLISPWVGADTQAIHHSHGLSRFDQLKYPADFPHFDYVNPDAPKGGNLKLFCSGTFDTLNPYALNGLAPSQAPIYFEMRYGFSELNEPLMVGSDAYSPSGDELKTAYGLIASHLEYPDDNQWVIFHLRPQARFHDNHPITADDVVFSFEQLQSKAHPRYRLQLEPVAAVEKLSSHSVRFTFKQPGNRSQLFRVAELPVLPKHYWSGKDFNHSTLTPTLNSGPYRIKAIKPGQSITFSRVPDYWGKDLPVNKGRYNFNTVTLDFHRDLNVAFEAFKAGGHDIHLEVVAKNWRQGYNFPEIRSGAIKQWEIPRKRPHGSNVFVFNTQKDTLKDVRVRKAISMMFDFPWTLRTIFHDAYTPSVSYFPNSLLGAKALPSAEEQCILTPWQKTLPQEVFNTAFINPATAGNGDIRQLQAQALALLKAAGWQFNQQQLIHATTGKPFELTILERSATPARYVLPWKKNLTAIGITLHYQQVDTSQYIKRLQAHDYDIIEHIFPQTGVPDQELYGYFHSSQAGVPNSHNMAAVSHPAIDHIVEAIPNAKNRHDMQTLTRGLDRILLWQYYGIPKWYNPYMWVAFRDKFAWPKIQAVYAVPYTTWWAKNPVKAK